MQFKKLPLLLTLSLTCFTTNTYADIIVTDSFSGKASVCEQITGHWTGVGKAVLAGGLLTCSYDGKVDMTTNEAADELYLKNLVLNIRKKESSPLCPAHEEMELKGECHNGKIIIHDTSSKLDGEILDEGKSANIKGTVTFTVPVIGKVTPDVDIKLKKDLSPE